MIRAINRADRPLKEVLLKGCLFLIGLCATAWGQAPLIDPNQETKVDGQAATQLQELLRELRENRLAYYQQKAEQETNLETARQARQILQEQVDELKEQETGLDQQIQTYLADIEELSNQSKQKAALDVILQSQWQGFCLTQAQAIKAGIPYKQRERLAVLAPDPTEAQDPNRAGVGQLIRSWTYARDELRLARSVEAYTDRVELPGPRRPYGQYFRIGHLLFGYVTEDGLHAAQWLNTPENPGWCVGQDSESTKRIQKIISILEGHATPTLVTLPVVISSCKPGEP